MMTTRTFLIAFSAGWVMAGVAVSPRVVAAAADAADGSPVRPSVSSGFFESAFDLRFDAAEPGVDICVTMDGSPPAPGNSVANGKPLRVERSGVYRAAAFKGGKQVGRIETRTFLFLRDVLAQTGAGFPKTWGINDGKPVHADYEMDPEIVNDPKSFADLPAGLREIPSLSLVLDPRDLFDPKRGIYSNPKETGSGWERPANLEFIGADGRSLFQTGCGARIQGGWNRRPEESPKHAFRIVFRKKYGVARLRFPLFGTDAPDRFDELILRAGCNNTWLHWSGEERRRGDYIRDQWMRDSYRAMGHPSARGLFAHLYLNGLYWGVYNLTERPAAAFAASHFGGKSAEYDSRNGDHILEGDSAAWDRMLALANGGLRGEREYQAIGEMIDLPAFADYMILNLYGANGDWDRGSNWYAARRRAPGGKFHFFVWDGERTLESPDADTFAFDDDQSPPRLFHKLRENGEFRRLFMERVRLHTSGNGVLAPTPAAERYRKWTGTLDRAIVAESARWGDYRRDAHPYKTGPYELYTREEHWRPEVRRILDDYFPRRAAVFLKKLQQEPGF
jgi:hypothetical protein